MISPFFRSRHRCRSACVDHKPRTLRVEPLEQRCMLSAGQGAAPAITLNPVTPSDSDYLQLIRGELETGLSYEAGLLYVTSDGSGTHTTTLGSPVNLTGMPAPLNIDGVADLIITRSDGTFRCTGSLLSSGQHVLTAAHCLTNSSGTLVTSQIEATWELATGDVLVNSTAFTVHPGYNGDFFNVGNDLAIVEFTNPIDAAVPRYDIIDTVTTEIDVVSVKVGYGRSGSGSQGDKLASGTKRAVLNEYDSDATPFGGTPGQANVLAYDFDSGDASNDGFAFHFGFDADTGYMDDEGGSAPGDSGGPTFLHNGSNWVIGGVTSYGVKFGFGPFTSDINKKLDSSWGEFGADTRVSSFATWIADNTQSTEPDVTPPVISDVTASSISGTSATITWTTDEAADSTVDYGLAALDEFSAGDAALVTSHSIILTGLSANTEYHYMVTSEDGASNSASSADFTFSTTAPDLTAPVISNVAASEITDTSATITWTTDEAADSTVDYGLTALDEFSAGDAALVTSHSIILTGLSANTEYLYMVTSVDGASNSASVGGFTFMTSAAPTVGTVAIVDSIEYARTGGRNNDKHLNITVAIIDDLPSIVEGASVSIDLFRDTLFVASGTATTGTNGTATFSLKNAQSVSSVCYSTVVTNVTAAGLVWDEISPASSEPSCGGTPLLSVRASSPAPRGEPVIAKADPLFTVADLLSGTQDDSSTDDAPVRRRATARRAARPAFSRAAVDVSMEAMAESRSALRHRTASRRMAEELPSELEELISAIS
ncbi:MAG: trypsin-like serine protease [Planctomycetes bacterium]|nr:trypsin-like serine protease [Planctomycetota bacterium]